jgi:hypothetical protein
MKKTTVIIKGNPKFIRRNQKAESFYNDLKSFFEDHGFEVSFDSGRPHTVPKKAHIWIGHSRGADRLRFAAPSIIVLGIGVPESSNEFFFPIINHPKDKMVKRKYQSGKIIENKFGKFDGTYHYVLTKEMKKKILEIIKR